MEESKSLSSFQIAGLVIQNYLKSLFYIFKTVNKRRTLKSFAVWKFKTLVIPKQSQVKIKNSVLFLGDRFRKFLKTLQNKAKNNRIESFFIIISQSKSLNLESSLQKKEETMKSQHQLEIQNLTKELKNMQEHQEELEKNWKRMKNREDNFKTQIQEISTKKSDILKSRKKLFREKEEELTDRIEELKDENSDIREKIAMIENNVANFIGEMGGLLEYSEAEKHSEKRRASVKKMKSGKKGRIPLFTVDMSKN
jgi:chromosome segregation ATPase